MAEEENVFVGTNCQSFDPSKVQCANSYTR